MPDMLPSKMLLVSLIVLGSCGIPACGQQSGVVGYWKEPEGSVIHVASCGGNVCATLVAVSPTAPSRVDGKNPAPALRHRPLCGLLLGEGFRLTSSDRAEGGTLYDPKSGKTYHGIMTAHGNAMDLRGYIGVALFGRTEHWTRTEAVGSCGKA